MSLSFVAAGRVQKKWSSVVWRKATLFSMSIKKQKQQQKATLRQLFQLTSLHKNIQGGLLLLNSVAVECEIVDHPCQTGELELFIFTITWQIETTDADNKASHINKRQSSGEIMRRADFDGAYLSHERPLLAKERSWAGCIPLWPVGGSVEQRRLRKSFGLSLNEFARKASTLLLSFASQTTRDNTRLWNRASDRCRLPVWFDEQKN